MWGLAVPEAIAAWAAVDLAVEEEEEEEEASAVAAAGGAAADAGDNKKFQTEKTNEPKHLNFEAAPGFSHSPA